jgi:hypothetical protein
LKINGLKMESLPDLKSSGLLIAGAGSNVDEAKSPVSIAVYAMASGCSGTLKEWKATSNR